MTLALSHRKWLISLVFLLGTCITSWAQSDTLVLNKDTAFIEGTQVEFVKEKKPHSPHKASFYAAILPGMGQIYNKKYWKLPILYGGIGATGYAIHFNSKYYKKYRSAYRDFIIQDPGNKSYLEFIPPGLTEADVVGGTYESWFEDALERKKQYYKRYRDLSYFIMVGVYIIQIVDAAVDAHFYNFSISDDLSMRVNPTIMESSRGDYGGVGIQLNFKF
ncbi:DUF5683 domain-containing protein [Carboxylicivirga linearis]|uniref:DUF5683 domain-containing protein n=1 Tax=Carboxylicivirga linearis TaxID=1628157 RepID=A0ABS5JPF7_9BACT|nr:DUF5683 domain-containing protein [Carboxylicivirga linearis]MBS2096657.1 hypothetical protein [Carboxylicivirga linearis]